MPISPSLRFVGIANDRAVFVYSEDYGKPVGDAFLLVADYPVRLNAYGHPAGADIQVPQDVYEAYMAERLEPHLRAVAK